MGTLSDLHISPAGRAMIERFEGLRLTAYQDIVGVWTIGYGHTGPEVRPGLTITKEQADQWLTDRLENEFGAAVNRLVGDAPTTQGQFDAMVSLTYNIGVGGFSKSSVLHQHLAGDYDEAADAFMLWNKAGGQVVDALDARRQEEGQVYMDASP